MNRQDFLPIAVVFRAVRSINRLIQTLQPESLDNTVAMINGTMTSLVTRPNILSPARGVIKLPYRPNRRRIIGDYCEMLTLSTHEVIQRDDDAILTLWSTINSSDGSLCTGDRVSTCIPVTGAHLIRVYV